VLEQYGGVYFDTDVEVLRNISPLLDDEGFIGFENDQYVASGLTIAAEAHHPVIQAMIEEYQKLHFTNADCTTNAVGCPHLNTDVMERFGLVRNGQEQLVAGIHVYPADYFNPLDSVTGKLTKTENTYSIHWYSMSWMPKHTQMKAKLGRIWRRTRKAIGR
jgi:mannosyltransferase OCH1-like enzyme